MHTCIHAFMHLQIGFGVCYWDWDWDCNSLKQASAAYFLTCNALQASAAFDMSVDCLLACLLTSECRIDRQSRSACNTTQSVDPVNRKHARSKGSKTHHSAAAITAVPAARSVVVAVVAVPIALPGSLHARSAAVDGVDAVVTLQDGLENIRESQSPKKSKSNSNSNAK